MNEKIDKALARFVDMKTTELSSLDENSMTIAEKIALKIIMDALSNGGQSMKLLVERIGGTPINKNISVMRDEKSSSIISSLEELLGGSKRDAIKKIQEQNKDSKKDNLILVDIPDMIESQVNSSDDNKEQNDEKE